ncbi:hypothetical protein AMTRI_Chr12g239970 [Amborella trichopoda]|uniref:VQ domain-containing protein n=1 Tax=Amborella trichopoda TaxID=13333 RepID=W1PGH6_AMBTC|nr:VQ motif-containing protein 4 [Amborella trichopoda]ERN07083.1 hypothetical protein AMTR_s00019p00075350 [Amborella trichopoda]|eukprot:XP_006845408.1 VQ motif-containing protein 4 [Amborella trichopoda]
MEKPAPTLGSPTTFVQADAQSFRELVQKLTGAGPDDSSEKLPITVPARHTTRGAAPSAAPDPVGPRRSAFKLHERRQSIRKLEIKLGLTSLRGERNFGISPRSPSNQILLSPTLAELIPSPVTPLGSDPFESGVYSPGSSGQVSAHGSESEEERALKERGFYLHPSPLSTPRDTEPELLPLFPLHSPRQSAT